MIYCGYKCKQVYEIAVCGRLLIILYQHYYLALFKGCGLG